MPRRLANIKKVDLSDIGEGWDGCYALVTKASLAEYQDFVSVDTENMTNIEATKKAAEFVKPHVVGGEIRVLDDEGKTVADLLQPDDIDGDMDIIGKLFEVIVGQAPDPKGSGTATETSPTADPLPSTSSTNQQ